MEKHTQTEPYKPGWWRKWLGSKQQRMVDGAARAGHFVELPREEFADIYDAVEKSYAKAGMDTPTIYLANMGSSAFSPAAARMDMPNAGVFHLPDHLIMTPGMVKAERETREQFMQKHGHSLLEAVAAHETYHFQHMPGTELLSTVLFAPMVLTMWVTQPFTGLFSSQMPVLANVADKVMSYMASAMVSSMPSGMLQRQAELDADSAAVKFTSQGTAQDMLIEMNQRANAAVIQHRGEYSTAQKLRGKLHRWFNFNPTHPNLLDRLASVDRADAVKDKTITTPQNEKAVLQQAVSSLKDIKQQQQRTQDNSLAV